MTVIGISGFATCGKTTAANYLESKYGVKRKHIAEPLRAMLAVLMRANGISSEMIARYLEGDLKDGTPIPELFGKTSRELQILIGTEFGREMIHPDLWASTWARGIGQFEDVMNDSVRFPNEEKAIKKLGGFTILIRRPGTRPAKFKWGKVGEFLYDTLGVMCGVHDSERTDRLNPDFVIDNDGTLEQLYSKLDAAVSSYLEYKAYQAKLDEYAGTFDAPVAIKYAA